MSERLNAVETVSSPEESNQLFGSKSGSTYYTPGCKSGNRVKIENRVYFENESAAEDEGYTKSKLCK
jgi:methylphosphotriester-DNA--protein-cysteine methyltransferase